MQFRRLIHGIRLWVLFCFPASLGWTADAAVDAAVLIHRRVAERFGGELRIGIGINTGCKARNQRANRITRAPACQGELSPLVHSKSA
jgi:hypothetical protein